MYISIYLSIYLSLSLSLYIHIYRERERYPAARHLNGDSTRSSLIITSKQNLFIQTQLQYDWFA